MFDDITRDMKMVTRKLNLMKLKKKTLMFILILKLQRLRMAQSIFIKTNDTENEIR